MSELSQHKPTLLGPAHFDQIRSFVMTLVRLVRDEGVRTAVYVARSPHTFG